MNDDPTGARTSKDVTLMRCPFCGAGEPDIKAKTLEPAFSYVHCERCGAQGPSCSDEPHAEIAWNTRQSDETEARPPGSGDMAKETALMVLCALQRSYGDTMFAPMKKDVEFAIGLLRGAEKASGEPT